MDTPKKEIALIGAGKIGKGYTADLFSEAGYHLIFLCHSLKQAEAMRAQGSYTIFKYRNGQEAPEEYRISDFEAYSTAAEYEQCLAVLARVRYATVHVYPGAFQAIGHMVGDAIRRRVAEGNADTLDLMLCLNYIDADRILKRYIEERLETEEERRYFAEKVGVGMALTFRWGAEPQPWMLQKDPLCACVAESPDLPVDAEAFRGAVPPGVALRPLTKMRERLAYKLWGGNVSSAILANLSMQRGYAYTGEGREDDEIYLASVLGTREAEFGFDQVYSLTPAEKAENVRGRNHGERPREQVRQEQGYQGMDPVTRVGADPARKLARQDRLVGPAIACIRAGRIPFFLAKAAAAGFYFKNPADASACEIQDYIARRGIEAAVERYCELDLTDPAEQALYQLILAHYYDMSGEDPITLPYFKR